MRLLRVAICQFESRPPHAANPSTVDTNFARLDAFFHDAASQRADLLVFPEYFLTGIIADHLHLATDEGHWVEDLRSLAIKYSIDVVAGTVVEKSALNDEHLFNTARYIDKHGDVLGEYRKKNLWQVPKVLAHSSTNCPLSIYTLAGIRSSAPLSIRSIAVLIFSVRHCPWYTSEKEYLQSATEEHQIFDTEKFKGGLLICWDLAWPEAFRSLLLQGVEVVIIPTCWVAQDVGEIGLKHDPGARGEIAWLDSMVISRAYENECCVIFVNCAGPSPDFLGRSAVALPFKGAVSRIESSEEEMRVVEVDLDILKDAKEVYRIREDLEKKRGNEQ